MDPLIIPAITCHKAPTSGPLNWLSPSLGPLFTDTFMAHIPSPFNPFLQTSPSQNHALLHSLSQGWLYFLFSTQPPLKPELKDVMNYVSFAYGRTPSFYSSSRYTTELDKLFLDSINLNMAQNSDVQSI